jgi:hypothetical protein
LFGKNENLALILEMEIENEGKIYLDMFKRKSKLNKYQVSTLTEVGSSLLEN